MEAARLRGGSVRSLPIGRKGFSIGLLSDGSGAPMRGEEKGARGALLVLEINSVAVAVTAAQSPSQSDRSTAIAVAAVKASAEPSAIAEAAPTEAAPTKAMPSEATPADATPAKAASTTAKAAPATAEVPTATMTTTAMTTTAMAAAAAMTAAAPSIGGGGECDCPERECRRRRCDDKDFNPHSHDALLAMCSNERNRRSFYARVESSRMTFEQMGDASDSLHFQQCLHASRDGEAVLPSLRLLVEASGPEHRAESQIRRRRLRAAALRSEEARS